MTVSGDSVEVELRVGMLDLALAKLMTEDHHTIEFPTILLPENVEAGSIVKLQCSRALQAEIADKKKFDAVQQEILDSFATNLPQAPVLRARNVTQTSVVLEWDPIQIATADLHFMALYKGDQRLGLIPQPLKRTVTKVSNLEIDAPYDFHLVLSTSAGDFESNKLQLKTHKMTDLTGVVVCLGSLAYSSITQEDIEESLKRLGCRPAQDSVKLDTTHFICTTEGGQAYERASELNIPIVRPEWLKACESERRLISVRGYYLSANPGSYPAAPVQQQSAQTQAQEQIPREPQQQSVSQSADEEQAIHNSRPASPHDKSDDAHTKENEDEHEPEEIREGTSPESETTPKASESAGDAEQPIEESGAGNASNQETDVPAHETDTHDATAQNEEAKDKLSLSDQALSSHDELSVAVNNVGDQQVVNELEQISNSSRENSGKPEEGSEAKVSAEFVDEEANLSTPHEDIADVSTERELEKELEEDPSVALREGEQQQVTVEQSESVEPQSADLTEVKEGETSADDAREDAATSTPKSKKGKKGKKNKKK